MRKGNWQSIEESPHRAAPGRGIAIGIVVLVVLLAVAARAVLLGLVTPPETAAVALELGTPVAETALLAAAGPSRTASPAPSRTPIPTPTPAVLRLTVEQRVYEAYASYFQGLPARMEGVSIVAYSRESDGDDVLAGELSDALLYWRAERPNEGAILVREEPYVVAAHYGIRRDAWTTTQLVAISSGKDQSQTLVSSVDDQVLRELLGVQEIGPNLLLESNWPRAKEAIATEPGHIGLLPWEYVDFRVRVLPIDGVTLDPDELAGYPLVRRMWLDAQVPMPPALLDDLRAAFAYDAGATITLAAVGDVMLASYVGETIAVTSPAYPFEGEGVQPALAGAEIAIGNLESAISERGTRQNKTYTFRAAPEVVEGLTYAGLDVLTLANNHTGDFGDEALLDTLDALDAAGLARVGAGRNSSEAREAKVLTVDGLRVAFLGYNQIQPESFEATESSPGSAWTTEAEMVADVLAVRETVDIVVVSCHWGDEYSSYANASQRRLARALADAGADLVLGHHPHVLQGLGFFSDAFVAYSLGNFVFYDMASAHTSQTIILRCVLDTTGVKTVEWIPISIVDGQPRVASAETATAISERILKISQEQNALPSPLS